MDITDTAAYGRYLDDCEPGADERIYSIVVTIISGARYVVGGDLTYGEAIDARNAYRNDPSIFAEAFITSS